MNKKGVVMKWYESPFVLDTVPKSYHKGTKLEQAFANSIERIKTMRDEVNGKYSMDRIVVSGDDDRAWPDDKMAFTAMRAELDPSRISGFLMEVPQFALEQVVSDPKKELDDIFAAPDDVESQIAALKEKIAFLESTLELRELLEPVRDACYRAAEMVTKLPSIGVTDEGKITQSYE